MPKGEAGQLEIEIRARLKKFEKDLKEAERKAAKSGKKIEKSTSKIELGGLVGQAAKVTAAVGTIETAFSAVDVASKVMKGNFEGAAEVLKQLPFGIGAATRRLEGVLSVMTGIGKQMDKIKKDTATIERRREQQKTDAQQLRAIRDEIERKTEAIVHEEAAAGLTPEAKKILDINRKLRQDLKTIDRERRRLERLPNLAGGQAAGLRELGDLRHKTILQAQSEARAAGQAVGIDVGGQARTKTESGVFVQMVEILKNIRDLSGRAPAAGEGVDQAVVLET
jgi:chromosome segregation ATPase